MKKLLEILSNPEKRMPLATLQKCEDVLKKMNLPDIDSGPEGSNSALPPSSFNPLLEAVLKSRSSQVNNVMSSSSSIIRLNNSTILFLKEVNKVLALVCILREENFEHEGLIDFNFACFRRAIEKVFEVRAMKRQPIGVGGKSGGANVVE